MATESDNSKSYFPWDEGIPTKPDVDALLKQWPPEQIKPGAWSVTDEEVRALIPSANSIRYRTVYTAWISRLARDHLVIVYRAKVTGFYCPTATEVYSRTHPTLEGAGRKIGKQLRGVSLSQPTNTIEETTKDHQGKLLYTLKREAKKARMNVLPSTASGEMPKIEPPQKAKTAP